MNGFCLNIFDFNGKSIRTRRANLHSKQENMSHYLFITHLWPKNRSRSLKLGWTYVQSSVKLEIIIMQFRKSCLYSIGGNFKVNVLSRQEMRQLFPFNMKVTLILKAYDHYHFHICNNCTNLELDWTSCWESTTFSFILSMPLWPEISIKVMKLVLKQ